MPANVIVIGDRSAETHHKLLYLITEETEEIEQDVAGRCCRTAARRGEP